MNTLTRLLAPALLVALPTLVAPVAAQGAATVAATTSVPLHHLPATATTRVRGGVGVYDARVDLLDDADGDGYYSRLAVSFDADDLTGGNRQVFAEIALVDRYGDRRTLLTTGVFTLIGDSSLDAQRFVVSLADAVSPGSFTLRVTLYDACCYGWLDTLDTGPAGALLLEDTWNDARGTCCVPTEPPYGTVVESGYGTYVEPDPYAGAMGWWLPLMLALGLATRRRKEPPGSG